MLLVRIFLFFDAFVICVDIFTFQRKNLYTAYLNCHEE
jgi:hypothetical protein